MLNYYSDGGEDELFYDSTDCLSLEESIVTKQENFDYRIWLNEPQSVKERRKNFFCEMGMAELASSGSSDNEIIGLERINNCSGAVSSSSALCTYVEEGNLVSCSRETNCQANSLVDELDQNQFDKPNITFRNNCSGFPPPMFECEDSDAAECKYFDERKQKMKNWWKHLVHRRKQKEGTNSIFKGSNSNPEASKTNRIVVKQSKKKCMEFTGVLMAQKIQAHKGVIWTMKFSPDGQYLATGGEDGVVRIWQVTSVDASCKSFEYEGSFGQNSEEAKPRFSRKKISYPSVVIPDKIFQIEESPMHEFYGHAGDVLDLAWSNSNHLLSSSKDKTVRLWQVGCNTCLNVFCHTSYVTCIQFNPVDQNYFISGSIDGKVRIWGVFERRVVNWVDARDVTSAVCYRPDGKGFVVGSITGTCRFYESSDNDIQLEAEMHVQGRKKSMGCRITGIQFSQERSQRVMISSEDSKLRIFDGVDIVHKYKGLSKSGSQMSASFTSTGRHIISVGEDCRVYVWNSNASCTPSSKHMKPVRSCEHFFCEGVSFAVPWSGRRPDDSGGSSTIVSRALPECSRDSDRFSIGNWFSGDGGGCRGGSATWPEENLPHWDVTTLSDENYQQQNINSNDPTVLSDAWGLVIVAAGWDGTIRTFHNYGLPVRL